jgi:F-type H+-transporting ATPase subunit a
MFIALAVILLLMIGATSSRALVPGRMQAIAEMSYEFVATTLRSTAGTEGMKFFPLVFSLFMFILAVNLIGLIPYAFTVTSHIIITVSLALLVFLTVVIYGLAAGLHFFNLFVPKGVPGYILPFVVFIEVFSFFVKPVSHSVRLFANMLAGHITLKVFASFVTMLAAFGLVGWVGAVLPLGLTVALTASNCSSFLAGLWFAISVSISTMRSRAIDCPIKPRKGLSHGPLPQNTSALESPASAWAAPVGIRHHLWPLPRGRTVIPRPRRPVRQSDLRLRGDGSARHLSLLIALLLLFAL